MYIYHYFGLAPKVLPRKKWLRGYKCGSVVEHLLNTRGPGFHPQQKEGKKGGEKEICVSCSHRKAVKYLSPQRPTDFIPSQGHKYWQDQVTCLAPAVGCGASRDCLLFLLLSQTHSLK